MAGRQGKRSRRRRSAASTPRAPGRPAGATGDRTRERIIAAAIDIFARHGLAGASVRDIARRARLRVSSLYHYFPSKDALYQEIVARTQEQIREIVLGSQTPPDNLRESVRAVMGRLFDFFLARRSYVRLGCRAALEGALPHGVSRWVGLTEGRLKPMELQGLVKEVDPVLFMVTMDALVHWHIINDHFYRELLGKGLEDPEIAARVREHLTQVALRTLGVD